MANIQIKVNTKILGLNKVALDLKLNLFIARLSVIAQQIAVNETPVDTGILRNNWYVKIAYEPGTFDPNATSVPIPQTQSTSNTFSLFNNIGYIQYANQTSYRKNFIEKILSKIDIQANALAKTEFVRPKV